MTENFLTDRIAFDNAMRVANAFSTSTIIPEHMQKNPGNCAVAMHIANQMGEDPLMVMQSMYMVNGRPGWMTNFLIARANRCGKFVDGIDWRVEGAGDDLKVTAFAQLRRADGTAGRVVELPIDYKTAVENGWTKRHDKKTGGRVQKETWITETMRTQMLRWRTASWLINLYAPEVRFGLPTIDELEDAAEMKDVTPPPAPKLDDFRPGAGRQMKQEVSQTEAANKALLEIGDLAARQGSAVLHDWWSQGLNEENRHELSGHLLSWQHTARTADKELGVGLPGGNTAVSPSEPSSDPPDAEGRAQCGNRSSDNQGDERDVS